MAQSGMLTNDGAYGKCQAITKSDATVYNPPLDAVLVNGAGNLAIVDDAGVTTTITGVIAGALLKIKCRQIMSTNTTATNVYGLNF